MAQSALANKGHKVGLLQGAGTRMALWFYAMLCLLCLRQPLVGTIHQQNFVDLNLNDSVRAAVHDIKDDKFWKCIYILLCAVFPALRLLRYCNKSQPAMDKIFFLSHRIMLALNKSEEFLNNKSLFGSLKSDSNLTQEGNIVLGEGADESDVENVVFDNDPPSESENESNDDTSKDEDNTQMQVMPYNLVMSFVRQVIWHWDKCKQHIEHEYAIAGWALCIMENVQKDVAQRLTGTHCDAIEKVVIWLHGPPYPNTNPAVSSMTMQDIVDTFWNEFNAFKNCYNPYNVPSRWASA
jgi:hypothetical protein